MRTIHVDDLVSELEFDNLKEFNNVLKAYHLDTLKRNASISVKKANEIALKVRRTTIDSYKYKQKKKILKKKVDH